MNKSPLFNLPEQLVLDVVGNRKPVIFVEGDNDSFDVKLYSLMDVFHRAIPIMECGIRHKDALHIACAIKAQCGYFLTTDKKVFKKKVEGIALLNPLDYIRQVEGRV